MLPLLKSLRPHQWTKNVVVFAGLFFSGQGTTQSAVLTEAAAFGLFCALSSAVYLLNDVLDVQRDRLHPVKRHRPIASGKVPIPVALVLSAALAGGALAGGWLVARNLCFVLSAYLVLQLAYSMRLKHVVILDVLCIATGFFLRVLAGVVALSVGISPWLTACSVQLALFLALCKRKAEVLAIGDGDGESTMAQRPILQEYAGPATDMMVGVMAASTLVTYTLYTILPSSVFQIAQDIAPRMASESSAGSPWMMATLPFVLYGMLRYLYLVYHREEGERPESILITDKPLIASVVLYAAVAGIAVYGAELSGG